MHTSLRLENVDPDFRFLADLLFFTNRTDLDISNFKTMFETKPEHYPYFWDRFIRSTEIFWEESFWLNRFEFVLDKLPAKMIREIENCLMANFRSSMYGYNLSPLDTRYTQLIAWIKAKSNKKENLIPIRDFLLDLPYVIATPALTGIISHFIPHIFPSMDEYIKSISQNAGSSSRSFQVLQDLEKQGFNVDKQPLFKTARDLLFKRVPNRPNRRSFFSLLADPSVKAHLKSEYKLIHRPRLISLLKECDYKEIEEWHLRNIGNLLELDESIAEELLIIYADRLYARGYGDKKANIQRLIRACKTYPQFSPKKVIAYLSANNRIADIKHLVVAFPDLKMLVPFV